MSARAFWLCILAMAVIGLLSWTDLGALCGFIILIFLAFFVAPPTIIEEQAVIYAFAGCYAFLSALMITFAGWSWAKGKADEARLITLIALWSILLPFVCYNSVLTLNRVWPH